MCARANAVCFLSLSLRPCAHSSVSLFVSVLLSVRARLCCFLPPSRLAVCVCCCSLLLPLFVCVCVCLRRSFFSLSLRACVCVWPCCYSPFCQSRWAVVCAAIFKCLFHFLPYPFFYLLNSTCQVHKYFFTCLCACLQCLHFCIHFIVVRVCQYLNYSIYYER